MSFGEAVANSPAVFKRDISVFDRLYTSTIEPIQNLLPPKHSVVMLTVSNGSVDVLDYFINKFGGMNSSHKYQSFTILVLLNFN